VGLLRIAQMANQLMLALPLNFPPFPCKISSTNWLCPRPYRMPKPTNQKYKT